MLADILQDLKSPSWWFSVVVVAVVVNLASSYIKSPIDRVFSKFWKGWRIRSEKRHARLVHLAHCMVADPLYYEAALAEEARNRQGAIFGISFGILSHLTVNGWFGSIFVIWGCLDNLKADRLAVPLKIVAHLRLEAVEKALSKDAKAVLEEPK